MLLLFRSTTKKAKNFRVLRLILNRYQNFKRDPGLLGPQFFLDSSLKVSLQPFCIAVQVSSLSVRKSVTRENRAKI